MRWLPRQSHGTRGMMPSKWEVQNHIALYKYKKERIRRGEVYLPLHFKDCNKCCMLTR